MRGNFDNLKMTGVAAMAPTKVINNMDLADVVGEKEIRKQIRATGIERKHCVTDGQIAVDLCVGAAKRLLRELAWDPTQIQVLIYVSSYRMFDMPSTAFYIQHLLGVGKECHAFDMNLACSGFVAGIEVLGSLLQHCGEGAKGLLLTGISPSAEQLEAEKELLPLFGDAGAAAAFEICEGSPVYFSQYSDGSRLSSLYKPMGKTTHMMGMEVFDFTIFDVADSINEFFGLFQLSKDDVDYFFLHQAQKFILDKLIAFCGFQKEKCPVSYREFGNSGAVSIPLTMCFYQKEIDYAKKNNLFLSGFGAGLSWGCVWMQTENLTVLPVIFSDEKIVREAWLK